MLTTPALSAFLTIFLLSAQAQATGTHAPYAGQEQREIKALSETDIADLRAGNGMGMALPAELNGYPGPRHVRDLGPRLGLTPNQQLRVEALVREMEAQAVPLGHRIIEAERHLDRLFASGHADDASLKAAVSQIADLRGALRYAHLRYHLATRDLLTPAQVTRYGEIRGYDGTPSAGPGTHMQH